MPRQDVNKHCFHSFHLLDGANSEIANRPSIIFRGVFQVQSNIISYCLFGAVSGRTVFYALLPSPNPILGTLLSAGLE